MKETVTIRKSDVERLGKRFNKRSRLFFYMINI